MTNQQLYLAIGVPVVVNGIMLLLVYTSLNQRISDLSALFEERLRRLEEVFDARLKHLEER